jgi:hypothetical protein
VIGRGLVQRYRPVVRNRACAHVIGNHIYHDIDTLLLISTCGFERRARRYYLRMRGTDEALKIGSSPIVRVDSVQILSPVTVIATSTVLKNR